MTSDPAAERLHRKLMNMDVIVDGFLNQTDVYDYNDDYQYKDGVEMTARKAVWMPYFYSAVVIFGLLENFLLLVVLVQKRRFWRSSDTFILQLGVVDVLLLVTLPFWAAQANQPCEQCSAAPFQICRALFNINFYVGMFLLVCISLENCLANIHSRWFSQHRPRFAVICSLSVWLLSVFLTGLDWHFLQSPEDSFQGKLICVQQHPESGPDWPLVVRGILLTVAFLLPLVTLIVCCSHILLRLLRSSKGLQKKKTAIFLLAVVGVFLVCWVPYNITLILDTFCYASNNFLKTFSVNPETSLKTAFRVTSAAGCVNACLRPLLYFLLCKNFRRRILRLLRCTTLEHMGSLWELGVDQNDQSHSAEELKQMKSVRQQETF